jgi:hypothetical protein
MEGRHFAGVVALALGVMLSGTLGISQSQPPTAGPAVVTTPAWFLQGSFPDPTGRTIVDPSGRVTVHRWRWRSRRGRHGASAPEVGNAGMQAVAPLRQPAWRTRQSLQRVQWKQTMGVRSRTPYVLPRALAVPAVALDSKEISALSGAQTPVNRSCSSSIE